MSYRVANISTIDPHTERGTVEMAPRRLADRRIVVGAGESPVNWLTLSWAVAEASVSAARLLVSDACQPDSPLAEADTDTIPEVLEAVDPVLGRIVAAAAFQLGHDRVSVVARPEPPSRLLVRLASADDMIVVGAPPRPGWLARESTVRQVLRDAPCPVAVLRPCLGLTGAGRHGPFAGHVVVGVDGSAADRAALGFGFGYAAQHGRPLVAVTVIPHAELDVWFDDEMLETHLTEQPPALRRLGADVEPWHHLYPEVGVKRAVFRGRSADGLLRAAEGACVLVLGTGARPAVARVLGFTGREIIDRAQCPVVVMPPEPAGAPAAMNGSTNGSRQGGSR